MNIEEPVAEAWLEGASIINCMFALPINWALLFD